MKWISLVLLLVSGFAFAETEDPFESINRKSHNFNEFVDSKMIRPVAVGYRKVVPEPIRFSVGRVFGNLRDVGDAVNNFLQGKPKDGFSDLARFTINSTVGIGGLFDPAGRMGLPNHEEDFAQTLAVWGVPTGPYLVVPLIGPSTVRDAISWTPNFRLDPVRYLHPVDHRNSVYGVRLIHRRADLTSVDSAVFGDKYIFYRDAFLQRRDYLEKDGEVEDPFDDEF